MTYSAKLHSRGLATLAILLILSCGVVADWIRGTLYFSDDTAGNHMGEVCIPISTPVPTCGWRMEVRFTDWLYAISSYHADTLNSSLNMDKFTFGNLENNKDLTGSPVFCLDLDIDLGPFTNFEFEGRLSCVCS